MWEMGDSGMDDDGDGGGDGRVCDAAYVQPAQRA